MSTSISFAISLPDQDTQTNNSFPELSGTNKCDPNPNGGFLGVGQSDNNNKNSQPFERRQTGSDVGVGQDFFDSGPIKLKRWRHHDENHHLQRSAETESKSNGSREGTHIFGEEDFYDEVDERMSRNSLEYPEQQARYIDRWLNEMSSIKSKSLDADESIGVLKGNVIGIRGFSSENSVAMSNRWREECKRLRADYLKLQSDHSKLRAQLGEIDQKYRKLAKRKAWQNNDADGLIRDGLKMRQNGKKKFVNQTATSCETCGKQMASAAASDDKPSSHMQQANGDIDQLKYELSKLELNMKSKEMEHDARAKNLKLENEYLRSNIEEKNTELDNLRNQIRNLSLEPSNRSLLKLHNENVRLRDLNEAEIIEFQLLKANYARLESQFKAMADDQKCLTEEKNVELNNMMLELCRLQVYLPKLELILDTERKIKHELQAKVENLQQENEQLSDRLDKMSQELIKERIRARGHESNEVDRLLAEVSKLQDKCHRLASEKTDVEELLRKSRAKVSFLDTRLQDEIKRVNESNESEMQKARATICRLETELDSVVLKLDESSRQLELSKVAKQKLNDELLVAHNKIELISAKQMGDQQLVEDLNKSQEQICDLQCKLRTSEGKSVELRNELESSQSQLEHSAHQMSDLRRRFELQLKAFDELKDGKDKELARLRVDLNFEQYNRQVALKGIERELRASLRELETMKCRFSNTTRLNVQGGTTTDCKRGGRGGSANRA